MPNAKLRVVRAVVSKEEATAIKRLARRDGLSVSRWCRRILVEVMRGRVASENGGAPS